MGRRAWSTAVALVMIAATLTACSQKPDYTARFISYTRLPGGEQAALVAPVQQEDERQTASTDITDLEPGDLVLIHFTGRSWDTPQSMPQREIVSRASGSK